MNKQQYSVKDRNWLDFPVTQIFDYIQRGKRLKKADHTPGKVPYVSSTSFDNGVDGFIEMTSGVRVFEDCISLANSGSVGSAFYEPFKFIASDHVTILKHEGFSKYVYLFLALALSKQGVNFNFNREINDNRITKMRIMLPVDTNNEPDYEFMENYVKYKESELLSRYSQYM